MSPEQAAPRRARRPTRALLRVRTGCLTCRTRKKKCDEGKPRCVGCVRNRLDCEWPKEEECGKPRKRPRINPETPSTTDSVSASGNEEGSVDELVPASQPSGTDSTPSPDSELPNLLENADPLTCIDPVFNPEEHALDLATLDLFAPLVGSPATVHDTIPRQPSLMPQLDPNRFALFGHYIQTTANSMANGSAPSNPFLVLLLPLATSSDLVLESILAQSCAHKAIRAPQDDGSEGTMLYNKSLRSIRTVIGNIVRQENVDILSAAVSVLIMCFTETARGDANGTIFDHLLAAGSLLPNVLAQLSHGLHGTLRDFLVEYFIYTATTSMVSMDAQYTQQVFLSSELLREGHTLAEAGYVGNLCGCWLKLLLFMPQILELAREWISQGSSGASPDLVTAFASLQMQISQWNPTGDIASDTALAGRIYQQAMLLYLLTTIGKPALDPGSIHASTIEATVNQALGYLEQLQPSNQINTSLCWPIAVIGSCVTCPYQQAILHSRLDSMANAIGLGNITRTREILDFMWLQNLVGPWEISKAMQASEVWISFA